MRSRTCSDVPSGATIIDVDVAHWVRTASVAQRSNASTQVIHNILSRVTMKIASGQTVAIVGPSGCGKTTLLNMMAGLTKPAEGRLIIGGAPARLPNRAIGYMTARGGLMPWRTVRENVAYGLQLRRVNSADARDIVHEHLEMVGLSRFADWYPNRLSQGMRQRVALARTLAPDPMILLMDEPFAALDVQTKLQLQQQFTSIVEELEKTVIWVTHDVEEAVLLGDRVIVLSGSPGRIAADVLVDIPRPRDIAHSRFTKRFGELGRRLWEYFEADL